MQEARPKRIGLYESCMTCEKGQCTRETEYNSVSLLLEKNKI